MNKHFFQLLLVFVLLVIFQELIIDKLPLSTYISPEVYLMFILLLPFKYSTIKSMIWALALGLAIDFCSFGVIGLHTIPLIFIAYLRPYLLKMVAVSNTIESIQIPSPKTLDLKPFITYISLSALIFVTILLSLDNYSLHNVLQLFLRIILSTMATSLLIIILQYTLAGLQGKKAKI